MGEFELKNVIVVVVILLAALLAAGLSIYQYLDGVKKDKSNDALQKKLIDTQDELINTQKETIKMVTGYGYAVLKPAPKGSDYFEFLLESRSEYPIYETEVYIYDQEKINDCPKVEKNGEPHITYDCYVKSGIAIPVHTLTSKKIKPLLIKKSLKKEVHYFITKTLSKHNTVFQYSVIESDFQNKSFNHYYRVFELIKNEFHLLERDDFDSNDQIFEDAFSFKKQINLIYN